MSTLNTFWRLVKHSLEAETPKDRIVAFLCGGLATMGTRRPFLRNRFSQLLDFCAAGGDVLLRLRKNGRLICFLMRKRNRADYVIGGEMVWGAYSEPPKTKPTTIVDGGANIGMFAIMANSWFPDAPITCYEPDASNLLQLERNLKINKICARVIPMGLWSSPTTLYYHQDQSHTGYIDHTPSAHPIACTVPEIREGCWLKLDVEGAEYEVLPMVLKGDAKPSFISMEIHNNQTRGITLIRDLENAGYVLRAPYDSTSAWTVVEAYLNRTASK